MSLLSRFRKWRGPQKWENVLDQIENDAPSVRTYGFDKTIHRTEQLDIDVHNGEVVAVWFRCQPLPFRQINTDDRRADEMRYMYDGPIPSLLAVEVRD